MYLLQHKFGDDLKYFVSIEENGWNEIYDPSYATPFNTKAEAIAWSNENTTFGEYATAVKAKTAVDKFRKWASKGMVRRSFPLLDKSLSRPYNGESPEEVLNWRLAVRNQDHDIRYEDYKTWPDLYTVFECLFSVEQYYENNNYDKKFTSVQMRLKTDTEFDVFKKELDLVIDHITFVDEDGYKIISIFDHYLGEGGNSVSFLYKSDEDCKIASRWCSEVEGNLKDVFTFWKKNRYYN